MDYNRHVPPPNPDQIRYGVYSFRWCDTEYTPRQLEEMYGRRVPFLVMTTQGYLGRDEWTNAVASDEIYWVKEIAKQPRIVVRNESDSYYSIPLNYPHQVIPVKNGKPEGAQMSVRDIVERGVHKSFQFVEEGKSSKLNVYHGADMGSSVDFGMIHIVDHYAERFLVVHSLSGGHLYHESFVIPLYMPITLVIAVGLARMEFDKFYETMLKMKRYIDSVPDEIAHSRHLKETSDILMFEGKPKQGEYDYLEPVKYVSLQRGEVSKRDSALYVTLMKYNDQDTSESANVGDGYSLPKNHHDPKTPKSSSATTSQRNKKSKGKKTKKKKKAETCISDVQFGGKRGPDTFISLLGKQGYHLSENDPMILLAEMQHVMESGIIPETTQTIWEEWTDSGNEFDSPLPERRTISHTFTPGMLSDAMARLEPVDKTRNTSAPPANRPLPPSPNEPAHNQEHSHTPVIQPSGNLYSSDPTGIPNHASTTYEDVSTNNFLPPDIPPRPSKSTYQGPSSRASCSSLYYQNDHALKSSPPNTLPKPKSPFSGDGASQGIPGPGPKPAEIPRLHSTCSVTEDRGRVNPQRRTLSAPAASERFDDMPNDVREMDIKTLGKCLSLLNLGQFQKIFEDNQIDGKLLVDDIDQEMLQQDLGMSRLQAMKLMKFAKEGWRPN